MSGDWKEDGCGESSGITKNEVTDLIREALGSMSEEERRSLLDEDLGWSHRGRRAQRWIAGILFCLGSIWAVPLVISIFVIVGIFVNLVLIFGWLIYGGWFYVLIGKRMSVSLSFFWLASVVVHSLYTVIFWKMGDGQMPDGVMISPRVMWGVTIALSLLGLGCERWVKAGKARDDEEGGIA